jgi:hypothetical protein
MSILRSKFHVLLEIQELYNIPQSTGKILVKWHVKDSAKPDARGKTETVAISNHKAEFKYKGETHVRIGVDKNGMLKETLLVFDVQWDQDSNTKLTVGRAEINLSEFVNRDPEPVSFLLKDSKINSALKISVSLKYIKGHAEYRIPPFAAPQINGDISYVGSEADKARLKDYDISAKLHTTFSIRWKTSQNESTPAETVEDIFAGGDGFGSAKSGADSTRQRLRHSHSKADLDDKPRLLNEVEERSEFRSWRVRGVLA